VGPALATRSQNSSRRQKIRGKVNTLNADNAEKYFCYLHEYMVHHGHSDKLSAAIPKAGQRRFLRKAIVADYA
jgi:hypothetical protein